MSNITSHSVREALANLAEAIKISNELAEQPSYRVRLEIEEVSDDVHVSGEVVVMEFDPCPGGYWDEDKKQWVCP